MEPQEQKPQIEVEGMSSLRETSVQLNELFLELRESGFTENQALFIAAHVMSSAIYIGPGSQYVEYNDDEDFDDESDFDDDGDFI